MRVGLGLLLVVGALCLPVSALAGDPPMPGTQHAPYKGNGTRVAFPVQHQHRP